ncbi:hypothetical protein [Trichothermofontia sp.]
MLEREIWLFIIYLLTASGLAWGLYDNRRLIEAPFLYAVGMFLIICPQLYVATYHYWRVPDQAFRIFSLMVVLCTIAIYWGYSQGNKILKQEFHLPNYRWIINDNRLFKVGLSIGILGTIGWIQAQAIGETESLLKGGLRGWPVYWYTLSKLTLPGISLILISYFQSQKINRLLWAIGLSIFPVLLITEYGRRTMTFVLPFVYLSPLLIYKPKVKIPRWLIMTSLVLALIVVYAFPYWRWEFQEGRYFSVIQEKPISAIISDMFSGKKDRVLEVIDGMIVTGAHYTTNQYGLGIDLVYNKLIHRYVPGSILGYDFKNSLLIGRRLQQDWISEIYGIDIARYTTKTAFSEVFSEFSFLGCLIFFYIGYLFRRTNDAIIYYFDGRAVIFLCFFVTLPASLPYSGILTSVITQVPSILIMLFAFKFCLYKQRLSFDNLYYYD